MNQIIKPQTLKGFRDFLPEEKRLRDYVVNKIRQVFELYGFEPLETPTLEYASLLLGKYGKEADKLVYRFMDQGDREIALRYDQTVPTARILSQYQNILPRYFRRYQIQNVFRAEKPQQGRYREFTQCDIDIFGTTSPIADAEIIACTYASYKNIGYPNIIIKINDRKILFETLERFATDQISIMSIIQSVDKFDRVGENGVIEELTKKGVTTKNAQEIYNSIRSAKITENLNEIISLSNSLGVPDNCLIFDPTIARGLDYYTGMIFEVFLIDLPGKSFGGGGRYDNLINQLSGNNIPAVGIAFGFDRMVEAAQQLDLIPKNFNVNKVLVSVFNDSMLKQSLEVINRLRQNAIISELYPASNDKLDKQLKYADRKGIPYVIIQGPEELTKGTVKLKNMQTKEQKEMKVEDVIKSLKS